MASSTSSSSLWQEATVPDVVSLKARDDPQSIYGVWPIDPQSYSAGVRTITYMQLDSMINALASYLRERLKEPKTNEILAYVGPNDVRFTALLLATIKIGRGLFLTSPRNSPEAHRALFGRLGCQVLITPEPVPPSALPIQEAVSPCQFIAIPGIDELLDEVHPVYSSITKPLNQSLLDPFFIIHTSGSTGLPKPLVWTQETSLRAIKACSSEAPDGLASIDDFCRGKRVLSGLPPFHGAGLAQFVLNGISFGTTTIIPAAAGAIVSAQGVVDALRITPADVAILVPSVVAELAQYPDLLDFCAAHLQLILYIGGDLPQVIGDRVASKIRLRCQWGASEVGIPNQIMVPELDLEEGGWRYVRFHPCTGAVFEEVTDGNYELVIRRGKVDTQPTFSIRGFEELEEYRTKDLFEPHPKLPDAWRWLARADDIIVFLNGEKTNPVSMEQFIVAHNADLVTGAIVIGAQRFQAALILEPHVLEPCRTTSEQASLIERVWPSIQEANRSAPAHARIEKSLIMVTDEKGLIRAGKGTIQRAASIAQYATEIDRLYDNVETSIDEDEESIGVISTAPSEKMGVESLTRLIRKTMSTITGWTDLDDTTPFFDKGMDSLQALRLTRALRKSTGCHSLSLSTVYQNGSALQLAQALSSVSTEQQLPDKTVVEELLANYRNLIKQIREPTTVLSVPHKDKDDKGSIDVILTGSTGTLGTSILHALLGNGSVRHVFCLNRRADGGRAAQHERFASAGLDTDVLSHHVKFLQANLAEPNLGLDPETYDILRSRTAVIIHNAWAVNFNLPLLSFRPQLAGLVNLLTLAAAASAQKQPTRTVFISSVGAVAGLGPAYYGESVPDETAATLVNAPQMNGYAQSKLLAEILYDFASQQLKTPVDIIRVGQVAGSTTKTTGAAWNRTEWLPSIVTSSVLSLGCLPDNLGPFFSQIDWIPIDYLGAVVTDLVLRAPSHSPADSNSNTDADVGEKERSECQHHAEVFNIRNPHTTSWAPLAAAVQETAQSIFGRSVQIVSPSTWLSKLQQSLNTSQESGETPVEEDVEVFRTNPAIKLFGFYRDYLWPSDSDSDSGIQSKSEIQHQCQPSLVIDHTLSASPTFRTMPPVGPEVMRKWTEEWIKEA